MKNTLKNTLFALVLVVAVASASFAQSNLTKTTLSVAMAAGARTMTVASATGISASTNRDQYYVLVEKDLRLVTAINGTTLSLGAPVGSGVGHVSGADVFFGKAGNWTTSGGSVGVFLPSLPTGSCSRGNQEYLPLFVIGTNAGSVAGNTVDCLGGRWVIGTLLGQPSTTPLVKACTVPIGSVAYGSMGTSTTTSTTGEFTASLFVPYTVLATGITQLNGSAVDTNSKKIVILRDSSGNALANSATAGTAATGNDAFQAIPFTATKVVVGPALYAIGLQDDTADVNGVRTVAASTFNNLVASSITSVFGTVAASVTLPSTFTADTGPIGCLY